MDNICIHYHANKTNSRLDAPFKVNFVNNFNEKIMFKLEFKGSDHKILNSFALQSKSELCLEPYALTEIEGSIKIAIPNKV